MKTLVRSLLGLTLLLAPCAAHAESWVGTWATSPMIENRDTATPDFANATLCQTVRVSVGGETIRLRLSNAFGRSALVIDSAAIALSADGSALNPTETPVELKFNGRSGMEIPAGAVVFSDPLDFPLPPLADVAITLRVKSAPELITGHPGARATSWWRKTADASAEWQRVDRWHFITGIDVAPHESPRAIALLGDSIIDGYGVKPGTHQRWTDELSRRLRANPATADIGVLNHGIGGNRLLRDGLGPNMLSRLERDVLTQTGVRWLVVLAGINDLGTRLDARKKGEPFASAADIIAAYEQIITRARTAGIKVIGATITPYAGADFYWSEDSEADRQTINAWIRGSSRFDAVIDFDAALRDPENPARLNPPFDSGDHLHPSMEGYAAMGRHVDLNLFVSESKRVALVFDDGPRPADAEPLLALLARENVPATFSLVGDRVRENPATARAIAAAGHELANHSQSHVHARDLDDTALDREVAAAQREMTQAIGASPRWYWPPFLEVDERVRAAVTRAGLTLYEPKHLVVSMDYDRSVPADEIQRRATIGVRDGSVILFHEWREETRERLPAILAELRRQGCVFLTFSRLHAAITP